MSEIVTVLKNNSLGYGFIDGDEYVYRNRQNGDDSCYRHLSDPEVELLERNRNYCSNWNDVIVKNPFNPKMVMDCKFFGKVRIGKMEELTLRFHDLIMPVSLTDSVIISSDIGDNCAIYGAHYVSNYIIHDYCMIHCADEIQATNHSKFGNGTIKEGEEESTRIQVQVMNENGNRAVLPFEDMLPSDAFLGANWPEDKALQNALKKMTDKVCPFERGYYGEIGSYSVIKNSGIIKDVKIGPYTYIKGATKLKNLTIKSCREETTQIGESCDLVNGIVGYGCRIFYGCKAVRFVMGEKSSLKFGARLINSVLGDNSTVSCCEVISNLVFPFHEQHHNNSFLISSLVMGQSNMAAGANIGSNHNSRSADCEMRTGRGFWPALSSTIKYDSHFASFTIISKGNFNYELNIKTPFSLLADNMTENRRELMPAYWWMYNMYALERNAAKFRDRDKRFFADQHIVTDYLAPDTAWEILDGIRLLCKWTASALKDDFADNEKDIEFGEDCLLNRPEEVSSHDIFALHHENSSHKVRVLKTAEAYEAYRNMLTYYGAKEIVAYCTSTGKTVRELWDESSDGTFDWTNMGGQLVPSCKVDKLRSDISNGKIKTWNEVHEIYDLWWKEYPLDKAKNAVAVLKKLYKRSSLDEDFWKYLLSELENTRNYIDEQVFATRQKDYTNKFRMTTFRTDEEHDAVIGKIDDNQFILQTRKTSLEIIEAAGKVKY